MYKVAVLMVLGDCVRMIGLFYVFLVILLDNTVSVGEDSLCITTLAYKQE